MYLFFKRLTDLIIASLALILLSPVFLLTMLVLSVTGEREIFYLQERKGMKNKIFHIIKFATMLKNSPNMGTGSITLRNDPRVTRVGHFLRITKLNEIPQLLNVIRGDMSIVGPRPLMPRDFDRYEDRVKARIYDRKPGITGIGSIVFRDEQYLVTYSGEDPKVFYTSVIIPYKGDLELWYHDHASWWTDFKLMLLTAWAILFPKSGITHRVFPSLPPAPPEIDPKKYPARP